MPVSTKKRSICCRRPRGKGEIRAYCRSCKPGATCRWGILPHARECAAKGAALSARSPASWQCWPERRQPSGNRAAVQEILAEMKQLGTKRYVSGYDFASVYLAIGDKRSGTDKSGRSFRSARLVGELDRSSSGVGQLAWRAAIRRARGKNAAGASR